MEPELITLQERESTKLQSGQISPEDGRILFEKYGNYLDIQLPSYMNENRWVITPRGWIGYIPFSASIHFQINPKIPLDNLFEMLNHAYHYDVLWQKEHYQSDTLSGFYDHLASILARKVLDRIRKGVYRSYIQQNDELPFLRERMNINSRVRSPWKVNINCDYHEHTPDIEDNQIIAWTLNLIARSGYCSAQTLAYVRHAYHSLESYVTLLPFNSRDCINRLYNRLNQDYEQIHSLCRFFLEQSGASHKLGERNMIPFLLEMDHLFELFVFEWLKKNLDPSLQVHSKQQINISPDGSLKFEIDMVLKDAVTGKIISVLDTKYKHVESPSTDDISQVISYADVTQCNNAVLIYPAPLRYPRNEQPGRTRIRTMTFDLSKNLIESGQFLIADLLSLKVYS